MRREIVPSEKEATDWMSRQRITAGTDERRPMVCVGCSFCNAGLCWLVVGRR